MAARRKKLKAELQRRRQAAREEIKRRKAKAHSEDKKKKRRWLWTLLLLLLLALLCPDCSCDRSTGTVTNPIPPPAVVEEPPAPLPRLTGKVKRKDRPEFPVKTPAPLPWLDAFRMQVSARSPRLATCFVDAQRPGMLRWSSSVDPVTGVVSQHTLEPTLQSEALSKTQRACVLEVLTSPEYVLEVDEERSTPSRVGMVIEF